MDGWVDGDKKGPDRKNNRWGQKGLDRKKQIKKK